MKKIIIALAAAVVGGYAGYKYKESKDKKANDGKTVTPSGEGQSATAGMGDPYFTQYIPLEQQVDYLYEPRLIQ